MKKRIEWVDIAKGITILLVIIGHSVDGILRAAIFSFHMPLFFILSGLTTKYSKCRDEFVIKTEKSFKHLFLLAAYIYLLDMLINILKSFSKISEYSIYDIKCNLANKINVFIMGSGVDFFINGTIISPIGIPWFLFTLFFGRTLFDYLNMRLSKMKLYIYVVVCSILGVGLGSVQWLPFSIDIALAIQPFFLFGDWLKGGFVEKNTIKKLVISFIVWAFLFFTANWIYDTPLELACRTYCLFPQCYIFAAAGTMFVLCISKLLSKIKILKPLVFLGKKSIVMFSIHCLDVHYSFAWNFTKHNCINILLRLSEDVMLFIIFMLICNAIKKRNFTRKIDKISNNL